MLADVELRRAPRRDANGAEGFADLERRETDTSGCGVNQKEFTLRKEKWSAHGAALRGAGRRTGLDVRTVDERGVARPNQPRNLRISPSRSPPQKISNIATKKREKAHGKVTLNPAASSHPIPGGTS